MIVNRGRVQLFMKCARQYYYTFAPQPGAPLGLAPVRTSDPLRIGLAAHKFLERWYSDCETPTDERKDLATKAMTDSFIGSAPKQLIASEADNTDALIAETQDLMDAYINRWGTNEDFTVLEPEVDGLVEISSRHLLRFQTDAVVSYKGRLWLLETKTTAQLGPSFFQKFMLNHQLTSYVYGVTKKLNMTIAGTFVNALRKRNPRAKVSYPEFARETVVTTVQHMRDMLRTFNNIADDITLRDPTNVVDWAMDTDRCHDYGKCPFWEVCALGAPAEASMLYSPRQPDYVDESDAPGLTPKS